MKRALLLLLVSACATSPRPTMRESVSTLNGPSPWASLVRDRTLLVFATTWCAACEKEWPRVRAFADARDGLSLVYVVSGSRPAEVRALSRSRDGMESATVVVDTDGSVARRYGVSSTPTLFLIDGRTEGPFRSIAELERTTGRAPVEDVGRELGTSYSAIVWAPPSARNAARADLARARTLVHRLERELSAWRDDSDVSKLNRAAAEQAVRVSPALLKIISGALHVARQTNGAFDPTWSPLLSVWEEAVARGEWPSEERLSTALVDVGHRHVIVEGDTIRFTRPSVRLGLDGLAKGWIIDKVFLHLRDAGYQHVLVNIGGDVRVAGAHRFDLLDPFEPTSRALTIDLNDTALATSGNYLRRRKVGSREVGHILDPRTGLPPAFDGSVTVLTRDATMADALATAMFVMGPDEGLALAESLPGLEVIYLTREGVRASQR